MSFGPHSRPRRGEQVVHQQAAESTVLLHLKSGEYFSLDPVGARVWQQCDGTRSVSEVIDVICAEYDAPAETISADVNALLDELRSASLLVDAA